MKLRKLDRTGHTELDLNTDEMIAKLEHEMNTAVSVVAEAPGREAAYVRDPKTLRDFPDETVVTVMPQLRGGV